MKRAVDDRRIVETMGVFDRILVSWLREGENDNSLADGSLNIILDMRAAPGLFDGWSDDGMRAVLLAFLVNCPEDDLEQALRQARRERRSVERMERQCESEDREAERAAVIAAVVN